MAERSTGAGRVVHAGSYRRTDRRRARHRGCLRCVLGRRHSARYMVALDRPSAGSVMFQGQDLATISDRKLADLRLKTFGFVFQQFNLVPTLSALENVESALAPLGGTRRSKRERALRLLGGVGLTDRA